MYAIFSTRENALSYTERSRVYTFLFNLDAIFLS